MPAEWTSVIPADPLEVIGAGRARFRVDDLLCLVELIEMIPALRGDRGGEGGDGGRV
jgi:hypothetical protein